MSSFGVYITKAKHNEKQVGSDLYTAFLLGLVHTYLIYIVVNRECTTIYGTPIAFTNSKSGTLLLHQLKDNVN